MNYKKLIVFFIASLTYFGVFAQKNEPKQKVIESLYNIVLTSRYTSDTAYRVKLLNSLIKESQHKNNLEKEDFARMTLMEHYFIYNKRNFNQNYDNFMRWARSKKCWNSYYYIFSLKIYSLAQNRNIEEAVKQTNELYNLAKKNNNLYGFGSTAISFGSIYAATKRYNNAEKYFYQAVDYFHMANSNFDEIRSYKYLLNVLQSQNKYKDIEKLLPKVENIYKKGKINPNFQIEHFYIDIEYAHLYINTGQYKKAKQYLHKIEKYLPKLAQQHKVEYWIRLNLLYQAEQNYYASIEIADSLINFANKTNNTNLYLYYYFDKTFSLVKVDNCDVASDMLMRYRVLNDSIDEIRSDAKLDELRIQYDVDKLETEKIHREQIIIAVSVIAILITSIFIVYIIYNRKITRKNHRVLSEIIAKVDLSINNSVINKEEIPEIYENDKQKLFRQLNEYMIKTSAYTNSNISRTNVARMLYVSENALYTSIRECVDMGFEQYIFSLRLERVKHLLNDNKNNETLEGIAFECGFNSYTTMYRMFKKQYEISPGKYRKQANDYYSNK